MDIIKRLAGMLKPYRKRVALALLLQLLVILSRLLAPFITRDIVERGKNVEWVIDRYTKTVKPMYLQFIAPSKRYADIIVPQGGHNKVAINVLLSGIRKMAKEKEQE